MKTNLFTQLQLREAVYRLKHLDVDPSAIEQFTRMNNLYIPVYNHSWLHTPDKEDLDFFAEVKGKRQILPYIVLEREEKRFALYVGANPLRWRKERPVFVKNTALVNAMMYYDGDNFLECYTPCAIRRGILGGVELRS